MHKHRRRYKSLSVEPLEDRHLLVTWIGPDIGLWGDTTNWDTGALPTLSDNVSIGPTVNVTISAVNAEARQLDNDGGLTILGGSLTLDHPSSTAGLSMSGGMLIGSDLTVEQALTWSGGEMRGPATTAVLAGASLTIQGGPVLLNGRTLANHTDGHWFGNGEIRATNGSVFDNFGSLVITGDGSYYHRNNEGATPAFNNHGLLHKSDIDPTFNSASTSFRDVVFNNSGDVLITEPVSQSGPFGSKLSRLDFSGGGSHDGVLATPATFVVGDGSGFRFGGDHDFGDHASITGTGVVEFGTNLGGFSGTSQISGTYNVSGPTFILHPTLVENYAEPVDGFGGELHVRDDLTVRDSSGGDASMSVGDLRIQNGGITSGDVAVTDLFWSGLMAGSGTTTVIGTFEVTGGTIDGRALANHTAGTWSGSGEIRAKNGAVFDNFGSLSVDGDGSYYHINNEGNTPVFNNYGLLEKSDIDPDSNSPSTKFQDVVFNNYGDVLIVEPGPHTSGMFKDKVSRLDFSGGGAHAGSPPSPATFVAADEQTGFRFGGEHSFDLDTSLSGSGVMAFGTHLGGFSGNSVIAGTYNVAGPTLHLSPNFVRSLFRAHRWVRNETGR